MSGGTDVDATSLLDKGQRAGLREIIPMLLDAIRRIPDDILSGFPSFDELPSGPTQLQNMSLAGLERLAAGEGSGLAGFDEARSTAKSIADLDPSAVDEYFGANIKDPMLRAFERDIVPGIKRTGFGEGSLFSGGEGGTEGRLKRADEELIRSLTEARSGLAYNQRAQALEAAGLLGNLAGQETAGLGNILTYGDTPRIIQEQRRQAALAELMRKLGVRDNRIQQLLGATTTTTSGAIQSQGNSTLDTILAGLARGAGSSLTNAAQNNPANQNNAGRTIPLAISAYNQQGRDIGQYRDRRGDFTWENYGSYTGGVTSGGGG